MSGITSSYMFIVKTSMGVSQYVEMNTQSRLGMKRSSREIRICGLNDSVQEIFKITGFNKIFSVLPGETEALASF